VISDQLPLGFDVSPSPAFGNFLAGGNGAALQALRDAASGIGPQFVHLWGPAGCGKSHLVRALVPGGAGVPQFDPAVPLYAVDDVHALDAEGQARLFALQDGVRSHPGTRLVSAGDAPPAALQLREDVRSRLGWGLVFQLHPIPESGRADALLARARARGVRIDEDLVPYMLTRLPRDMRTLVSVLDALDDFALARGRALTVPLLREWLQRSNVE
jgi:DnaA family protein